MKISIDRLYSPEWKLNQTIEEINRNELSYSDGPIEVSYNKYDNSYRVIDGHHRLIEAFLKGNTTIEAFRSKEVPSTYNYDLGEINVGKKLKSVEFLKAINTKDKPPIIQNFFLMKKASRKEEDSSFTF